MRNLGQRISLIEKLRKLACSEERINDTGERTSVNQIYGCEDLIVTHIHTLTNSTCHTGETYAKLGIELLTNGTHTAITQVINIINFGLRIHKCNQVTHDRDDIFFREHQHLIRDIEA